MWNVAATTSQWIAPRQGICACGQATQKSNTAAVMGLVSGFFSRHFLAQENMHALSLHQLKRRLGTALCDRVDQASQTLSDSDGPNTRILMQEIPKKTDLMVFMGQSSGE